MARGERDAMERRHHRQRVAGSVAHAPFGSEAFPGDAALTELDGILDLALGERERGRLRRHRAGQEDERRDGAAQGHGVFPTTTRLN